MFIGCCNVILEINKIVEKNMDLIIMFLYKLRRITINNNNNSMEENRNNRKCICNV